MELAHHQAGLFFQLVQSADIGWPTGNGKKLNNSQACCLAQKCLAAAYFLSISCGQSYFRRLYSSCSLYNFIVCILKNLYGAFFQPFSNSIEFPPTYNDVEDLKKHFRSNALKIRTVCSTEDGSPEQYMRLAKRAFKKGTNPGRRLLLSQLQKLHYRVQFLSPSPSPQALGYKKPHTKDGNLSNSSWIFLLESSLTLVISS